MVLFRINLFLVLSILLSSFAMAKENLKEGQVWETPVEGLPVVMSLVQKIEPFGDERVIHITPLEYDNASGEMRVIAQHLPFAETAFRSSATKKMAEIEVDKSIYTEGYNQWKKAKGGIFTLSLNEVLHSLFDIDPKGTMTLDPNDVALNDYVHDSLPDDLLARIKATTDVFEPIDGMSFETAVDMYRRDIDPEPNVVIWEEMARAYKLYCPEKCPTKEIKKEVYTALLLASMLPKDEVFSKLKPEYMTEAKVKVVVDLYTLKPQPIPVYKK